MNNTVFLPIRTVGSIAFALLFAAALTMSPAVLAESTAAEALTPADAPQEVREETFREKLARNRAASKQRDAATAESSHLSPAVSSTLKRSIYFLGFLLLGFSVYKKLSNKSGLQPGQDAISLIARHPLGGRTSLLIVNAEGERFLLSQSGDEVTLLSPLGQGASEQSVQPQNSEKQMPASQQKSVSGIAAEIEQVKEGDPSFQDTLNEVAAFDDSKVKQSSVV